MVVERVMQDKTASMVSRIATILGELGRSERLVRQLESGKSYSFTAGDIRVINENIDRLRNKGQIFLKEAINRSFRNG